MESRLKSLSLTLFKNNRIKRLLTGLCVGILLVGLSAVSVFAETESSDIRKKPHSNRPVVESVILVEIDLDTEVTAMTPLHPYRVKTVVSDVDTIDDILQLDFHIYHQKDGKKWDADERGIFRWDKTSGWSMLNGTADTTWELIPADCVIPTDFNGNAGEWYLAFKPGKIARADNAQNWYCSVSASDAKKNAQETWTTGASMSAYSEMAFDTSSITFGDIAEGIPPGSAGYITNPVNGYLTINVISNSQYSLGVQSDAAWSDGGSASLTLSETTGVPYGPAGLSLEIDDKEVGGGAPGQPKNPQAITTVITTINGYEAVERCTTGAGDAESIVSHCMYMGMWLSTAGIQEVVYSGAITFTLQN